MIDNFRPGLDSRVSYPGLEHVDELNRVATKLEALLEERDLFRGTRIYATLSDAERLHIRLAAMDLRGVARRKYAVLADLTASGKISGGICE